jgi:hypothetical protein
MRSPGTWSPRLIARGQAQYIARRPARSSYDGLAAVMDWALEHLGDAITIEDLARISITTRAGTCRASSIRRGGCPASVPA